MYVCGCVCVCVCVCVCEGATCLGGCMYTTKTPDQNDFKLSTVVVLDTLSRSTDFGFKRARVGVTVKGFFLC